MTIPLPAPLFLLALLCLVWPRDGLRIDWAVAAVWMVMLLFCASVWALVGVAVWWWIS